MSTERPAPGCGAVLPTAAQAGRCPGVLRRANECATYSWEIPVSSDNDRTTEMHKYMAEPQTHRALGRNLDTEICVRHSSIYRAFQKVQDHRHRNSDLRWEQFDTKGPEGTG